MADRGDAIKMSIDPKRTGIVRRLVGIFVRGKRGNQREKTQTSRKTRNQQLAVRFFGERSEHDDETLSSSTLSPTFAKEIQEVCIDDFEGCLPTLHGEEDFSIASICSVYDGELHKLNQEATRRREWKESTASQLRPVLSYPTDPSFSSSDTTGNESNVSAFSNIYTLIDVLVKESGNLDIKDYWNDTQSRRTAVSNSIFSNTTKSLCIFHDDESVTIEGRARNIKPSFIAIRKRSPTVSVDRHRKERHCGHRGSPRAASYNHPLREVIVSCSPRCDVGQRVIPGNFGMSGWEEFERQASGNIDEMVDEGVATARLSEHILSPTPKRQEKVII